MTYRSSLAVLFLALVQTVLLQPVTAQQNQAQPTANDARLLRYPDIHRDQVAFVYAGDIYVASRHGGTARRLTSHEGLELFPKFSPDGSRIAFSAEYNGTRQVYVMDRFLNDVNAAALRHIELVNHPELLQRHAVVEQKSEGDADAGFIQFIGRIKQLGNPWRRINR